MFLEQIRGDIKLSKVISRFVKLQKKGKDHFGLCPFHNESSPSFSVNDEKRFYHCFGCGAHGDVINFIQKMDNLNFRDAVHKLAKDNGIAIPKNFDTNSDAEKEIIEINKAALELFSKNLYSNDGSRALEYLTKRGMDQSVVNKFFIGYAKDSKSYLFEHLKSKHFSLESLKNSGLLTALDNGGFIDKFRDRVMFPIFNKNNQVIAFGGRSISNTEPKYLNSPETIVFQKRQVLYGENWIKPLKDLKNIYVVEGYTDVIALHGAGIINVVATLGTAISPEHLKKLWNLVECPVICMDGDAPGEKAMERGIDLVLPLLKPGVSIKFLQLPSSNDPYDIVTNHGAQYAKKLFAKGQISLSDAIWNSAIKNNRVDTPENQALLSNFLNEKTSHIQDYALKSFYRKYFNEKISELLRSANKIKRERDGNKGVSVNESSKSFIKQIASFPKIKRYQLNLIAMILAKPELLKNEKISEGISSMEIEDVKLQRIRAAILEIFTILQKCDTTQGFSDLFQIKLGQAMEPSVLSYLCGTDSYFIDRVGIAALDIAENIWFKTLGLYDLEILKKEYEFYVNKSSEDSNLLEIAMKLRQEIINIESRLNKTYI